MEIFEDIGDLHCIYQPCPLSIACLNGIVKDGRRLPDLNIEIYHTSLGYSGTRSFSEANTSGLS